MTLCDDSSMSSHRETCLLPRLYPATLAPLVRSLHLVGTPCQTQETRGPLDCVLISGLVGQAGTTSKQFKC